MASPIRIEDTVPVRIEWSVAAEQTTVPTLRPEDAEPDLQDYVPGTGDHRERVLREICRRRGQQGFRAALLEAFGGRCAISGCDVVDVLDAAHIRPHRGDNDNHPSNGLLLRSDIHTLFDLNLLGIEPATLTVRVHATVRRAPYDQFDGMKVPNPPKLSQAALFERWQQFLAAGKQSTNA